MSQISYSRKAQGDKELKKIEEIEEVAIPFFMDEMFAPRRRTLLLLT